MEWQHNTGNAEVGVDEKQVLEGWPQFAWYKGLGYKKSKPISQGSSISHETFPTLSRSQGKGSLLRLAIDLSTWITATVASWSP